MKPSESVPRKLASMVAEIDEVLDKHIGGMTDQEINFALEDLTKFLKLDLIRNFEKARASRLKESPFNDILEDNQ